MIEKPHPMDYYYVLDQKDCEKQCFKWKKHPPNDDWWEMDSQSVCPHLQTFMGYDGETVLECDKRKGAYDASYANRHPYSIAWHKVNVNGVISKDPKVCPCCGRQLP